MPTNCLAGGGSTSKDGWNAKVGETSALLPVRVIGASVTEAERSTAAPTRRTPSGMIHVELPKGQLRIAGRVDAEALRVVLEKLLG